jgi:hypothetical protein
VSNRGQRREIPEIGRRCYSGLWENREVFLREEAGSEPGLGREED